MKTIRYIGILSMYIIILIVLEGKFTLGAAFEFQTYSIIGWIVQWNLMVIVIWVTTETFNEINKDT